MMEFKYYTASIYDRNNVPENNENVKYFAVGSVFLLGLYLLDVLKVMGILLMILSSVIYFFLKVLNWNKVEEDGILKKKFILNQKTIEIGSDNYLIAEIESLYFFVDVIRGEKEK